MIINCVCTHGNALHHFRLLQIPPEGARDHASCGTTRIITLTGPALSAAIQLPPLLQTPIHRVLVSFSSSLLSHGHRMMESVCLDDSSDTDADWSHVEHGYNAPNTPSTVSDQAEAGTDTGPQRYDSDEDDEYGGSTQVGLKRKKGGYDSRIEQILYENPDLPILIVDAGKSSESGGKYIVYTIRTGVLSADLI